MATRWEPVEDGDYGDISVSEESLSIHVDADVGYVTDYLPDNIRLCRRVEAPSIPPEVAETIRRALEYCIVEFYDNTEESVWRENAALAWLEGEAGNDGDTMGTCRGWRV